jgi:hypothetical protein
MSGREGQRIIGVESAGAVALGDLINHLVGVTATLFTRPAGKTMLVLSCEAGSFRVRLGDRHTSGLVSTAPGASVTNGSGSLKLAAGDSLVLPAPAQISAIGASATDILTYYWL